MDKGSKPFVDVTKSRKHDKGVWIGGGGRSLYPPLFAVPHPSISLETPSSPSPLPPPPKQCASPPLQSSHHLTGLNNGFELSELTETEQNSAETKSKANVRKQLSVNHNSYSDPNPLSGQYAGVWKQDGKVIANLFLFSACLGTRG